MALGPVFNLSNDGMGELLLSDEMLAAMREKAEAIAEQARMLTPSEFVADIQVVDDPTPNRARVQVHGSVIAESQTRALGIAMDAARDA